MPTYFLWVGICSFNYAVTILCEELDAALQAKTFEIKKQTKIVRLLVTTIAHFQLCIVTHIRFMLHYMTVCIIYAAEWNYSKEQVKQMPVFLFSSPCNRLLWHSSPLPSATVLNIFHVASAVACCLGAMRFHINSVF